MERLAILAVDASERFGIHVVSEAIRRGAAQQELEPLSAELVEDAIDSVEGAKDPANLPLAEAAGAP